MKCCCSNCSKDICLKKVSLFNSLSDEELLDIRQNVVSKEYSKGDLIFREGSNGKTLYFINEGKIKLYKYTKYGKEQILHILSDGDFFGELNLLKDSSYKFNAMALSDCKICSLSKDELKSIIMKNPEIGIKILEILAERLSDTESLVQNIASNDGDSRIAYLLIELAEKYGEPVGEYINIDLPILRDDMANYTGVTRETISRKLRKFHDDKLIKVVGTKKIVILDKKGLKEYI
ncbi:Crp/Fnr family transcriptional regulator [Clostridium paraputrificum]|uniref:Crp/Fnr family transcriptional regulator n=1 Tax=Clostridium TaxID=1485 RepID=UPI003D354281